MQPIMLICPKDTAQDKNERMAGVLAYALNGMEYEVIKTAGELQRARGRKLLFAVSLGESGINLEYYAMLRYIRTHPDCFEGCTGGIIVDGTSELYTKSTARELAFAANCSGCAFVGRPLVEGTKTLDNFTVLSQLMSTDNLGAYHKSCRILSEQLIDFNGFAPPKDKANILVLHASSHKTSNTMALWNAVCQKLGGRFDITEIGLRNGTLSDCSGCPYTTCLHFGERGGCFYGGVMVDEVYPAVLKANAIVMICPNYNDSLSANLTACINRLTALFRTVRFYDKALFGIVVSGYSGSDIVAQQLISALNMNKTFFLPPRFCMMETANNAGAVLKLPGIESRIADFAKRIENTLTHRTEEES